MAEYAEFRLQIERGPTPISYRAEASGIGGDMRADFELPFTSTELENFILKVGRTRRGVRRIESPEMELARAFGGRLFDRVMGGGIGERYRDAQGAARAARQGLRVTLDLTDVPELAAIPWEFLYDAPDFLSTSTKTPVVRYLDVPRPSRPLELTLPLHMLAVVCAPKGAEPLSTGTERERLELALKPVIDAGAVTIDWLEHATLLALTRKLRPNTYHILHFIGHGGFDESGNEGALLFEDDNGFSRIVSGDQLTTILKDRDSLRLVVLNSCEGARSSVDDPFSGVAARLIQGEIPAVIGMQFEITDRAAILFAQEFYAVLAEGRPVDAAVAEARLAIYADQNDVEWGTPALFMRVSDGRLFEIANAVPIPRAERRLPEKGTGAGNGRGGPRTKVENASIDSPAVPAGPPAATPATRGFAHEFVRRLGTLRGLSPTRLLMFGVAITVGLVVLALFLLSSGGGPAVLVVHDNERVGYIVVTASGFQAGETVDVAVGQKNARMLADSDGAFTVYIDIGAGTAGSVVAVGRSSGRRAEADYALAPISSGVTTPSPSSGLSPSPKIANECGADQSRESSILFYSDVNIDGDRAGRYALFCIDPATKKITALTIRDAAVARQNNTFATWSPDHLEVAFTSGNSGDRDIYIRHDDGTITGLAVGQTDDYFPAWASTGLIAFGRGTDNSSIQTMKLTDAEPASLVDGRYLRAPAFSPDGSTISFFGYNAGENYDVATVPVGGDKATWIRTSEKNERNPSWSPDGRTIAFVMDKGLSGSDDSDNDVYVMDLQTRRVTQLTGHNARDGRGVQDGNPVWSPDGSQIAFYRDMGNKVVHLWIMNRDGSAQHDLMPNRA